MASFSTYNRVAKYADPMGYIDAIWRATQAGALTWQDAEYLQTSAAPR